MPISGINMTYNNTGVIGPQDGDIQIKLKEGHRPTDEYVQALREQLPRAFPGMTFAFLPADIVSQILNFGAPAPIDLQIRGANLDANFAYANKLLSRIRRIPGIADARIQQSPNNPTFNIDVDRTRAQYVGLTERAAGVADHGRRKPAIADPRRHRRRQARDLERRGLAIRHPVDGADLRH